MTYDFKLPDVGEGLTEGEVVKWHVKEGDSVKENQPLVNVLTDKAEVEIPSPKTGKILKLMAKEGQKVPVGGVLVTFDMGGTGNGATAANFTNQTAATPAKVEKAASAQQSGGSVNVMPAVRKLAGDLRVDLARVHGTGPGGRITEADVRRAAGSSPLGPSQPPSQRLGQAAAGPEERIAFAGIRRRTAEKMALSTRTIPHVTHVDEADCTALVSLRNELKPEAEKKEVKLTYLAFILKALVKSLKEFPNLNASLDEDRQEIVLKKYYNIGIATATPNGLYVPIVKDADKHNIWELAANIERLAEKARSNKLEVSELQGGTFTVTNIGPIGGLFATPIILQPETGILGVMKLQERPVARDGAVVVRSMMNLALSFDHRVLDGAEAANFMNTLIRHLENPRTLL